MKQRRPPLAFRIRPSLRIDEGSLSRTGAVDPVSASHVCVYVTSSSSSSVRIYVHLFCLYLNCERYTDIFTPCGCDLKDGSSAAVSGFARERAAGAFVRHGRNTLSQHGPAVAAGAHSGRPGGGSRGRAQRRAVCASRAPGTSARSAAAPCSRVPRLAQAAAALREALGIKEESAQQAVQTLASKSREARNFSAAAAVFPPHPLLSAPRR